MRGAIVIYCYKVGLNDRNELFITHYSSGMPVARSLTLTWTPFRGLVPYLFFFVRARPLLVIMLQHDVPLLARRPKDSLKRALFPASLRASDLEAHDIVKRKKELLSFADRLRLRARIFEHYPLKRILRPACKERNIMLQHYYEEGSSPDKEEQIWHETPERCPCQGKRARHGHARRVMSYKKKERKRKVVSWV